MTNGGGLHLLLVTPERKVLEEAADSVTIPATDGYLTILPLHAPLIATIGVGVLTYRRGGREASLAIVGGFFEVSEDRVTVLADEAMAPEEIDVPAARRELEEGRAALATTAGAEQARARLMISRAEAKLAVAGAPKG